jgi:hypothetical protein
MSGTESKRDSTYVTQNDFVQLKMDLQQRDEELLRKIATMFSDHPSMASTTKPIKKAPDNKAPPIAYVKTEKFPTPPMSDEEDNQSTNTSGSDVEFIRAINKVSFLNEDTLKKLDYDRLLKIQDKWQTAIPMLSYVGNKDDHGVRSHNYVRWISSVLKYFSCLSPQLAQTTKSFLNQIDVDAYLHSNGKVDYPILADEEYTDLMKLSAMSTIASKVSEDFQYLVNDDTLTNIFPTLLNIHMYCNPNSADDRTDQMGELFKMKMRHSDKTVINFGNRLKQVSININNQFGSSVVTDDMLVSVLKIGVAQGSHSKAYVDALKHMKFLKRKIPFQAMVNLLHHQRDRSYDQETIQEVQEDPVHASSANMARTRGGYNGGKGRGRGGRGGRGGLGDNNRSFKNDRKYYMNTTPDGEDVVTAPIHPKKNIAAPCFNQIRYAKSGGCKNRSCPFNHEFTLVDTRRSSTVQRKVTRNVDDSKYDADASTSEDNHSTTHQSGNNANSAGAQSNQPVTSDEDDDDPFDYFHDLGYSNKSSFAQQDKISSDHMDPVPFSLVVNFIPTLASKFVLSLKYLFFCLMVVLLSLKLLFDKLRNNGKAAQLCSAANPFLRATYQVIMDGGCTWSMSGDFNLFLPGSLMPKEESVGLAESGYAAQATHYGKLCIQGKLIDALYVPKFKQTMISQGQMEKMGLRYQQVNDFRDLVTPSGSIFLSFTLTKNNLYELNERAIHSPSTNSASPASTTERSA